MIEKKSFSFILWWCVALMKKLQFLQYNSNKFVTISSLNSAAHSCRIYRLHSPTFDLFYQNWPNYMRFTIILKILFFFCNLVHFFCIMEIINSFWHQPCFSTGPMLNKLKFSACIFYQEVWSTTLSCHLQKGDQRIDFGSTMKFYLTAPFGKWKIQKSEYEGKKMTK